MATTTNYSWETPDDTDLVKDGAAAIRTLGSSIDTTTKALNPSTTLGDIEYRSSTANTNTRLGIGTTGQVLTVSGGVPAWSTPSSSSGPTFLAYQTSTSGISGSTWTKVTFATELFDTGSNFASSRFTPTTAGYYQINFTLSLNQSTNGTIYGNFYKNGSAYNTNFAMRSTELNFGGTAGTIMYFNGSTDYVEVYVFCSGSSPTLGDNSTFSGVWIRS